MINKKNIIKNYTKIKNEIGQEKMLVVTKTWPMAMILPLIEAGHREFAENRVQEAIEKWHQIRAGYPDLRLFFIGPLQTNKIKEVVLFFDHISTLSRKKEVDKIVQYLPKDKAITFSIQVNLSQEPQKSGVPLADFESLYHYACGKGLEINGVMCLPEKGAIAEKYVTILKALKKKFNLETISYGMSADYLEAIKDGTDQVRLGSAIFGERKR